MAGVNLQLAVEVAHVGAHGVVAHVELIGDTALAVPLGEEEEHVNLAPAGRTATHPMPICRPRKPKRRQVRRPGDVMLLMWGPATNLISAGSYGFKSPPT